MTFMHICKKRHLCIYAKKDIYAYMQKRMFMHICKKGCLCIYEKKDVYAYMQKRMFMHICKIEEGKYMAEKAAGNTDYYRQITCKRRIDN